MGARISGSRRQGERADAQTGERRIKPKKPRGRAYKRAQYNRRFVAAVIGFGKKRGPNSSEK
ncbi:40S ribosomal protein S30 [Musa troglodytarum]|uniref:40S ribosomal protein S30 n=1 Tax=Musa troglodytarum TaxID=320322 RepID=A0A9E7FLI8_9LILI|nr:40S ribosomal protein S30 [Musa troglodytarum]